MNDRWSKPFMAIHWLTAAIVIILLGDGFFMTSLSPDSVWRRVLGGAHAFGGLSVLALTLTRVFLRFRGPRPAPVALPPIHRQGVAFVHGAIYVAVLSMAGSGIVTVATSNFSDYVLGKVPVAPELGEMTSRQMHGTFALLVLLLAGAHVGGVIVEQVRRGGVLGRMIPFMPTTRARQEKTGKATSGR